MVYEIVNETNRTRMKLTVIVSREQILYYTNKSINLAIYVGDGTFEPMSSAEDPRRDGENEEAADCNWRVIEGLISDGVGHR